MEEKCSPTQHPDIGLGFERKHEDTFVALLRKRGTEVYYMRVQSRRKERFL